MASYVHDEPEYSNTKNRVYSRWLRELLDISEEKQWEIFHETFSKNPKLLYCEMSRYRKEIKKLRNEKKLSPGEYFLIYPKDLKETDSRQFDSPLLTKLIATFCGLTQPRSGWARMPDESDLSKAAHIVRLTNARHMIQHSTGYIRSGEYEYISKLMINSLIALGVDETKLLKFDISVLYDNFSPVSNFSGRKRYIEDIHNEMTNESAIQPTYVVIYGTQAIGKSELARVYCQKYKKCFTESRILWINSEHENLINDFFRDIANKLNLFVELEKGNRRTNAEIVHTVHSWFETKNILYVFNKVPYMESIIDYLPTHARSKTLVTSQSSIWTSKYYCHHLQHLTKEESIQFLTDNLDRQLPSFPLQDTTITWLGGNPLLLQTFVKHANETRLKVERFAELFNQNMKTHQYVVGECEVVKILSALDRTWQVFENESTVNRINNNYAGSSENNYKGKDDRQTSKSSTEVVSEIREAMVSSESKDKGVNLSKDTFTIEKFDLSLENLPNILHKRKAEKLIAEFDPEKEECITLGGNHHFIEKEQFILGEGAFGKVYLGFKANPNLWVAVKVVNRDRESEKTKKNNPKEVTMMSKINCHHPGIHENILHFFKWYPYIQNRYYILVVELCDMTLPEYLENSPKKLAKRNDIAIQLLSGLSYLHSKNLAHRDLKPTNLMLKFSQGRNEILKLCDYGVSKVVCEKFSRTEATMTGHLQWCPPENGFNNDYLYHNDILVASMLMVYILSNGEHPFLTKKQDKSYYLQKKFDDKATIRKELEISDEVRKFLDNIFLSYYELLSSGKTTIKELEDIKSLQDSYQELYFTKNPEHTQGLRYTIFIRFDYLYTVYMTRNINKGRKGWTDARQQFDDTFQGNTDVLQLRNALESCKFVEREFLYPARVSTDDGDVKFDAALKRILDKTDSEEKLKQALEKLAEREVSTVYDPSVKRFKTYMQLFREQIIHNQTKTNEPFYVIIPIFAHGAQSKTKDDLWLKLTSFDETEGIFLKVLLAHIKNELGSNAHLIVLCSACRDYKPLKVDKSVEKYPEKVFILFSVEKGKKDKTGYRFYSPHPSKFSKLVSDEIKPGNSLIELEKKVFASGGDSYCEDRDRYLFDSFIF